MEPTGVKWLDEAPTLSYDDAADEVWALTIKAATIACLQPECKAKLEAGEVMLASHVAEGGLDVRVIVVKNDVLKKMWEAYKE